MKAKWVAFVVIAVASELQAETIAYRLSTGPRDFRGSAGLCCSLYSDAEGGATRFEFPFPVPTETDGGMVPQFVGGLFAIYMVLAYLAIGAYGKAMLATSLAPRWLARTHVIFGLVGAAGFLARVPLFVPPLMIHLVPGILGVTLLRGASRRPPPSRRASG